MTNLVFHVLVLTAQLKKEETGLSEKNEPLGEVLEEPLEVHLEEAEEVVVKDHSRTEETTTTGMVEENQSMIDTLDQIKQESRQSKREMEPELIIGVT